LKKGSATRLAGK